MIGSADILEASILIVDDQDANVSLLEQMLRGTGYISIAPTRDPHEVCEFHRKNRYDCRAMPKLGRIRNPCPEYSLSTGPFRL
jgi:PleD family two-component response regulator